MKGIAAFGAAIASTVAATLCGIIGLVTFASAGVATSISEQTAVDPSDEALHDIPAALLERFVAEAANCVGLPWTVLAAISKVESDHARVGGSELRRNGVVEPWIIGTGVDATSDATSTPDTDRGRWDRDPQQDRAVGPFQFMPGTWRIVGIDANDDGVADPHNFFDALQARRRQLCGDGHVEDIVEAVRDINSSDGYVAAVIEWSGRYTAAHNVAIDGYALPLASGAIDDSLYGSPHHDYPAWDAAVPIGTPVYAIAYGTVVTAQTAGIYPVDPIRCGNTIAIAGTDGAHYLYCHLSQLNVSVGQAIEAGTLVGHTGGQPGTPGAGNTTGPHLHIGIRIAGRALCPQPLLLAIALGRHIPPSIAPSAGCVTRQPLTDWNRWLNNTRNG